MMRHIALIASLCLGCADEQYWRAPDASVADGGVYEDDGPNFLTDCTGCPDGYCPSDCTEVQP